MTVSSAVRRSCLIAFWTCRSCGVWCPLQDVLITSTYNAFQVLLALRFYASGNFCAKVIYHKVLQIKSSDWIIHHLLFAHGCTLLMCVLMRWSSNKQLLLLQYMCQCCIVKQAVNAIDCIAARHGTGGFVCLRRRLHINATTVHHWVISALGRSAKHSRS